MTPFTTEELADIIRDLGQQVAQMAVDLAQERALRLRAERALAEQTAPEQ